LLGESTIIDSGTFIRKVKNEEGPQR